MAVSGPGGGAGWRVLGQATWERRGELAVGCGAGVVWQAAAWLAPLAVARAVDEGIVARDRGALAAWTAALAALAVVEAATTFTRHRFACIPAKRSLISTRARLHARMLDLDASARDHLPAGEVVARATSDAAWVEDVVDYVPSTVACVVSVVAVSVVLVTIDPIVAAAGLAPLVLLAPLGWAWSSRYESRSAELQAGLGQAAVVAETTVSGFRAATGLGAGPALVGRWTGVVESVRSRALAVARVDAVFDPALEALTTLAVVGGLWVGGRRVLVGDLGVGELVAVVAYVVFLTGPLQQLGEVAAALRRARAAAARLGEVLDARSPLAARGVGAPAPAAIPAARALAVAIEGVRFAYPCGDGAVLDGCTLSVPAGSTVAVVGATGSGKSTLAGLVARRHDPVAGTVRIGGVEATRWPLAELRAAVQVVGSDEFLFSDSVAGTVAFGRPELDPADCERVAALAGAHGFVATLAQGYATPVGERGRRLSGGQRQRLALARALAVDPPVVVLDDGLASVDPALEAEIVARLAGAGPTLILLTARAEVACLAPRVVLLDGGRIAADGSHDELWATSSRYRQVLGLSELVTRDRAMARYMSPVRGEGPAVGGDGR